MIYIDNWLSSQKIMLMDASEERGYFRLLLHAAKQEDAGLPDDDAILSSISLLGPQWFKPTADKSKRFGTTSGQKIRTCFIESNGRLYNERLSEEHQRWLEVKTRRSAAARVANEKRWGKADLESYSYPSGSVDGSDSDHKQIQPIGGRVEGFVFKEISFEELKNLSDDELSVAYFGIFVAAGKALNEVDKRKYMHEWLSIQRDEQELAYLDAQRKALEGIWPSAKMTPYPVNHLRDKAWTRESRERTLPVVDQPKRSGGVRNSAFEAAQ